MLLLLVPLYVLQGTDELAKQHNKFISFSSNCLVVRIQEK